MKRGILSIRSYCIEHRGTKKRIKIGIIKQVFWSVFVVLHTGGPYLHEVHLREGCNVCVRAPEGCGGEPEQSLGAESRLCLGGGTSRFAATPSEKGLYAGLLYSTVFYCFTVFKGFVLRCKHLWPICCFDISYTDFYVYVNGEPNFPVTFLAIQAGLRVDLRVFVPCFNYFSVFSVGHCCIAIFGLIIVYQRGSACNDFIGMKHLTINNNCSDLCIRQEVLYWSCQWAVQVVGQTVIITPNFKVKFDIVVLLQFCTKYFRFWSWCQVYVSIWSYSIAGKSNCRPWKSAKCLLFSSCSTS